MLIDKFQGEESKPYYDCIIISGDFANVNNDDPNLSQAEEDLAENDVKKILNKLE